MNFKKFECFNKKVGDFYNRTKTGIFLFDLLPGSATMVYHDLNPNKGIGNGVVVVGDKENQERLSKVISEKLLRHAQHDGLWENVVFLDDLLVIIYGYSKSLETEQIIELLSLKLRYDLAHVCGLDLSPLSLLQIKIKGEIHRNIPIKLAPEQELLQSLRKSVTFH